MTIEMLFWGAMILGAIFLAYSERGSPAPDSWIEHPRAPK